MEIQLNGKNTSSPKNIADQDITHPDSNLALNGEHLSDSVKSSEVSAESESDSDAATNVARISSPVNGSDSKDSKEQKNFGIGVINVNHTQFCDRAFKVKNGYLHGEGLGRFQGSFGETLCVFLKKKRIP